MQRNESGFHFLALALVVVAGVIGFVGWKVYEGQSSDSSNSTQSDNPASTATSSSDCPAQPMLASPANLSLATSVLYPGQVRGGDYKAHGGLRFDNSKNSDVVVKAPLAAKLTSGSRYIEQGETQVLLEFTSSCGINYRFDHLLTLSDKIQKAVDASLPAAKVDDSRTTNFEPAVEVTVGEIIATAVGFKTGPNVSFDFGVYDKRQPNGTNESGTEYARHGVCWLKDWLPASDSAILSSLPAGDFKNGKTSDYCK